MRGGGGRPDKGDGLAVMNADGTGLHVLVRPSSTAFHTFWQLNWDAAGDRLVALNPAAPHQRGL